MSTEAERKLHEEYRKDYEEEWKLKIKQTQEQVPDVQAINAKQNEIHLTLQILRQLKSGYLELIGDQNKGKKQEQISLAAKKSDNLSEWYAEVLTKSKMIDFYTVPSCYVMRPWAFEIWQTIKDWLVPKMKDFGAKEFYSPLLVSRSTLTKHKPLFMQFEDEIAWVTKYFRRELTEPIALRPTSESVIYPVLVKWIQSYRDLPLRLHQFNYIVRYKCQNSQALLRMREFLWQEGHCAYATKDEACQEQKIILELYERICTDLLALPTIKGYKTEKQKFAGATDTLTLETFVSASGRTIQAGISHYYGKNFSQLFDVVFEDPETQELKFVEQNAWSFSTRSIGAMVLEHGDDKGLVLPPGVAPIQVVIIPFEAEDCGSLDGELSDFGIKVHTDSRTNYSTEWKISYWALKGVPIRIELKKTSITAVRRDTGEEYVLSRVSVAPKLKQLLDKIQKDLLKKATVNLKQKTILSDNWIDFNKNLHQQNLVLAPFCGEPKCEEKININSVGDDGFAIKHGMRTVGAEALCIPLEQPRNIEDKDICIYSDCGRKARFFALFGSSY